MSADCSLVCVWKDKLLLPNRKKLNYKTQQCEQEHKKQGADAKLVEFVQWFAGFHNTKLWMPGGMYNTVKGVFFVSSN